MPLLSKPSSAARTALIYITAGSLMVIWTGVYYWWRKDHPTEDGSNLYLYCCAGFLVTGLTLFVIGLGIGQIGRNARQAELPPREVTSAEARVEQLAAARAPMVAPVNPAAAAIAPGTQGVVSSQQTPTTPQVPALPVTPGVVVANPTNITRR